jgi:hypothetical protein
MNPPTLPAYAPLPDPTEVLLSELPNEPVRIAFDDGGVRYVVLGNGDMLAYPAPGSQQSERLCEAVALTLLAQESPTI